jgi:hypothetical protein
MSDASLYAEIYTRSSGTRTYGETTQMSGGRADGWTGLSSPQEPIQVYGPVCAIGIPFYVSRTVSNSLLLL